MTTFRSSTIINKPAGLVYTFLADMSNHQQLMPDTISEWISTVNDASFSIQNMLKLFLKIETRIQDTEIKIVAVDNPPFQLEVKWLLSADTEQTNVELNVTADLNGMMKMMASGPLQKLTDHQVNQLNKILS